METFLHDYDIPILTNLNGNMRSATSMAQDAYKPRTPGFILGFRGFKSSSNIGDLCFFLNFGTSYVALFNGLMISDIRILVLHVYFLYIHCNCMQVPSSVLFHY